MKYRLKKDLPTFKAGEEFVIAPCGGGLWRINGHDERGEWYSMVCAYSQSTLDKFPNILTDWFEEIPEKPKTVWDLKYGDDYFSLNEEYASIDSCYWGGYDIDRMRREIGNAFLTKEDAEEELARRKAGVVLRRDTKGFKPDWSSPNQKKYSVVYMYNYAKNNLTIAYEHVMHTPAVLYFASKEDAEASIKAHEKEWKIYLGVEDAEQ